MASYIFLFVGGNVPAEAREQNMKQWGEWFGALGATGKLRGGAPFGPSKVVSGDGTKDYDYKTGSNVSGYCVVETDSIDAAIELTKGCPQLAAEYGSGTVEVREAIAM